MGKVPKEWNVCLLEDICSKITDGSHFSPKEDRSGEYLIATVKDFSYSGFDVNACKRISKHDFDEIAKRDCKPLKGDVLFSKDGTIGITYVSKDENKLVLLSSIAILRPNAQIDSYFLNYYLRNKKTQNLLKAAYVSGSALPRIVLKDLKKLKVILPSIKEQTAIAKILGDLDSKIALNTQMNKVLEVVGEAVFRRWFVDFEFPNEEGTPYKSSGGKMIDSELGEIPKGWEITDISKVTNVIDCLHSKKPERVKEGKILLQVFNIEENGELNLSEFYYVSDGDYDSWTRKIEVKKGDSIISKTGRVGAIAQIPEGLKFGIGRNLVAIRPTKITPTFTLEYLLSKYGKREIQRMTMSGTILRSLHVKYIKKFQILAPPPHVINLYEKIARPFRAQIENNLKENIILTRLRETLLPKLMSGKIRVPIVKDKVEAS